ncbi:MAG: 1-acyl-sn-glycerol-3-phosphate acyltransferase [Anaerolineales bacterium]
MNELESAIRTLGDSLIYEILNALGLPKTPRLHRLFRPLFGQAVDRLSAIGVAADRMIATRGFPAAAAWMASHWVRAVDTRGSETIPAEGPLLMVANHPGAYDILVLPSRLGRRDVHILSSDIPFLKSLPNASQHLIFLSQQIQERMAAAREAIRRLQSGAALLLFGSGLIDPDPAVYPNAEQRIEAWSPSIDLFLRQVPQAQVLLAIISGVIAPEWARHPLTRLRRLDWHRQRLAEFGQIIQQLFRPGQLYLQPRLSFAPPVSVETLRRESGGEGVLPAVIARGKALLAEHLKIFGGYAR